MSPERWRRIDAVFLEAARLNAEERRAYLDEACGGDRELRFEVESLLAHDGAGPLDGAAVDGFETEEIVSVLGEWCDRTSKADGRPPQDASALTVGAFGRDMRVDPVVGWLVCVKGPDLGRDYRIRAERNRIGRDTRMDICVSGDNRISRDSHALITYDSRHNQFQLSPGQARGLVYLNGRSLDGPSSLEPFDMIELGETGLHFVPLCGEHFKWK